MSRRWLREAQEMHWSDWLISKPVLLPLEWAVMGLTVFLGRGSFLAHVFLVTFLLLVVLYKINLLYGTFANPHYYFYIFVLAGGAIHTPVPIVGHFFPMTMFIHLGVCFLVHVMHLTACYLMFADIQFKDNEFIAILWIVNIAEMVVNLVFVFDNVFSDEHYIACSLATQTMILMIVNLKLTSGAVSSTASAASDANATEQGVFASVKDAILFVDRNLMSRISLLLIGSSTVGLIALFPADRYLIFMVALSVIMRLCVRKVNKVCFITSLAFLLDKALMIAPIVMIALALLTRLHVLDHATGTVLTLVTLILGLGVMFVALFTITDGLCATVPIAFLVMVTAGTTSIVYLLQDGESTGQLQFFASVTISTSLLFFLSKIKVSDQRSLKIVPVLLSKLDNNRRSSVRRGSSSIALPSTSSLVAYSSDKADVECRCEPSFTAHGQV